MGCDLDLTRMGGARGVSAEATWARKRRLSLKSTKKKGEEPVEPPLSPDPLPPVE